MRLENPSKVLFLHAFLLCFAKTTTVRLLSIPEGQHTILTCPGHTPNDSAPLEWRDGTGQIIATKHGQIADVPREYEHKYSLLLNGSLFIKYLQLSDSGEFRCGAQLVAEVEVLTGQDYVVDVGRTLTLPCRVTEKQKQKWMFRKSKQFERTPIYIKHKNGTLSKEIADPQNRYSHTSDNALHISNLQPEDAGEYWCNGKKAAVLTVRTEKPDFTNQTADMADETDTEADVPEEDDSEHESVMLAVIISLCVLVLLAGLLILLLLKTKGNRKGNTRTGNTRQNSQLQTLSPAGPVSRYGTEASKESQGEAQLNSPVEMGEIHYASLGRQNWRERPRSQGESHHVIYSTVAGGGGEASRAKPV
ncbi:hypothetical protein AGOR_G00043770 [Albula goreensis]|uniref:Ig-like domain-containing protein n=1 Tax=Albula goreensis TaxID=1534307 RepID=A0A8T3DZ77_9TELE|nr:hypothetical protein AGOR_G00043770 [Albula goreensis]